MKLGDKLRRLREARGWTQPEAAEAIGIEQSYLSKLENDHSVPSVDVFRRITDAYGTDVASIVESVDEAQLPELNQISDIADFVSERRRVRIARERRSTSIQTIAVALGAGLLYAGLSHLFFPTGNAPDEIWKNQVVTFIGICTLTWGILGLLIAGARAQRKQQE